MNDAYFHDSLRVCISILAVLAMAASCGDPNADPVGPTYTTTINDSGGGTNGSTGPDAGTDVDIDDGAPAVECPTPQNLGHLGAGAQGTTTITLEEIDSQATTCLQSDADQVGTGAVEFTTDGPAIIEWTYVTDAPANRIGSRGLSQSCHDLDSSTCQVGRVAQFFYDGASPHLFLAEMAQASSVMVAYKVEAAVCDEPGATWCDGGQLNLCYQGRRVDTYGCAGGRCSNSSQCAAHTCPTAMEVTPGTAETPTIVDGHRRGYDTTGHFEGLTDCELDNILEESAEIFFYVDDLPDDQDLVIESLGQGIYGFFILEDCHAKSCLARGSNDGDEQNRLRWSPESSQQSAIIAIRPSDTVNRSFSFALYFDDPIQ